MQNGPIAIATLIVVAVLFFVVWGIVGSGTTATILTTAVFLGALFGQAKDVVLKSRHSGNPWRDASKALHSAYSDEHGAGFLLRSVEWVCFAVAAIVLAATLTSSGADPTIPEETESLRPAKIEIVVPPGNEITLPEGTMFSFPIEVTVQPETEQTSHQQQQCIDRLLRLLKLR